MVTDGVKSCESSKPATDLKIVVSENGFPAEACIEMESVNKPAQENGAAPNPETELPEFNENDAEEVIVLEEGGT